MTTAARVRRGFLSNRGSRFLSAKALGFAGRVSIAVFVGGAVLLPTACARRPNDAKETRSPRNDSAAPPASGPADKAASRVSQRPKPAGRPAPTAQCGHAVAFAGWRPDGVGVRDVLLVCDPGDNVIEATGHAWDATPRGVPVHYGRQRPTIVLQPAGAFTVTGAIIVTPRSDMDGDPRMVETLARAMPDLSQDFSEKWSGLCGPTCAADVLFSMHDRDDDVLAGVDRGPGDAADAGVVQLVAGGIERIEPRSLAGRMGVGQDGIGATNEGMRRGLASWLDETDPEGWKVELDWFGDADGERPRAQQREFFGRLAAATEAGGGAILCLWPGSEFADQCVEPPTAQPADTAASGGPPNSGRPPAPAGPAAPQLPEAEFPAPPSAAGRPSDLPGRPEDVDQEKVRSNANRLLEAARRELKRGDAEDAYEAAVKAVALLSSVPQPDDDIRATLADAIGLCRQCAGQMGPGGRVDRTKPTEFQ